MTRKEKVAQVEPTLNSNLILLIRYRALSVRQTESGFKFQSDSINTPVEVGGGADSYNFKFQSDSINTQL